MVSLWSKICQNLAPLLDAGLSEEIYQKMFEAQLKTVLGWGDPEIQEKVPVPMGRSTKQADIVLDAPDTKVVIEMKKPGLELGANEAGQLISYMRILRAKYGLLVGSRVKIFYDDDSTDTDPVDIANIPFDPLADDGRDLAQVLERSVFAESKLKEYCIERISRKETARVFHDLKVRLVENDGRRIKDIVKKELIQDGYNELKVEDMLAGIAISSAQPAPSASHHSVTNDSRKARRANAVARQRPNGISASQLVSRVAALDMENHNILKNYIGLNSSPGSSLRSKEFSRIRIFPEARYEGDTLRSREVTTGVHIYTNYTKERLAEALAQYEKFFSQGGI